MELSQNEIEEIINSEIANAIKKYGKEVKATITKIVGLEKLLSPTTSIATVQPRIIPLSKWNEYHADPTVPALRMLDFKRAENGFEEFKVTERRGSRVLINEENYFKWYNFYKNQSKD